MSETTSADSYYPIKGIPLPETPDPDFPIPIRREINSFYKDQNNARQVSLYIQALANFQKIPYEEKLSYFQIAGIHGLPAQVWDNGGTEGFYCAHGLPTFPTWHRVYLTLYEQRLHEEMLKIIEEFKIRDPTEKALWSYAADRWRLPYWDYAATPAIPEIAAIETIDVIMPGGDSKTYNPNPMWTYRIATKKPMGDDAMGVWAIKENPKRIPWDECIGTSRHAIVSEQYDPEKKWIQGISNSEKVTNALAHPEWNSKASGTIRENVYRLFTDNYFESWRTFASTKYYNRLVDKGQKPREWLSLEAIHNMIHLWTGGWAFKPKSQADMINGTGHMCHVPVAAFDPIFWHHHCFIDRCAAIWQTLNQDQFWFDHPLPFDPSIKDPDLQPADPKPDEPLYPFHKKAGPISDPPVNYNSNDVRKWTDLNYQYGVLQPIKSDYIDGLLNQDIYTARIRTAINNEYSTTRKEMLNAGDAIEGLQEKKYDYIINILYDRYAINGGEPYIIHCFVGPVGDDFYPNGDHPNRVGSAFTFSSPYEGEDGKSKCKNCRTQNETGALSCAQIPITGALLGDAMDPNNADLTSLEKERVEMYLKYALSWKVFKINGDEVPLNSEEMKNLKVAAFIGTGDHWAASDTLSSYMDYSPLWDATSEKVGGAQRTLDSAVFL